MEKRIIPHFESEAEEAKWWFDNREELDKDFAQAFAEGRLKRRTEPRTGNLPTATIRNEGQPGRKFGIASVRQKQKI